MPEMNDDMTALMDMLSGLCAFYTSNDLASFLFSEKFRMLVGEGEPWIIFEIGIYRDHLETIEVTPVQDGITIADSHLTENIPNNIHVIRSENEILEFLTTWYGGIMTESASKQ
jgi:hypothetical protein